MRWCAASISAMKIRSLLSLFSTLAVLALPSLAADKPEPNPTVTTTKRSAVKVGNSSFALVKGTKLEVIGREDKLLLVKYRTSQGKIPYADTDYVLPDGEEVEEPPAEEAPATAAPVKPVAPPAAKNAEPTAAPKTSPSPALSTDGIRPATAATDPVPTAVGNRAPATNYGKAVQKARQAEQAHKEKLVNPTDEILDEKPKK